VSDFPSKKNWPTSWQIGGYEAILKEPFSVLQQGAWLELLPESLSINFKGQQVIDAWTLERQRPVTVTKIPVYKLTGITNAAKNILGR